MTKHKQIKNQFRGRVEEELWIWQRNNELEISFYEWLSNHLWIYDGFVFKARIKEWLL